MASYNPKTGEFRDYGHLYKQNWAQYPRSIAADDTGWVYFGIGSTSAQVISLDPKSGQATPLIPEAKRIQGAGTVYRDVNGKVYATDGGKPALWMELYQGQVTMLDKEPAIKRKAIIEGSQGLFHRAFPSGQALVELDLLDRELVVEAPKTKERRTVKFDYTSEGAHIMAVCAAPNDTMCGGSAFPMNYFGYNPDTDQWDRNNGVCQWNTVTRQGDRFYVGGYGHGILLEWDPTKPWVAPVKGKPNTNPLYVADTHPDINRPHELLAHPDGKTIILAGTPGYGYTGGGVYIWDRETRQGTLLKHTDLLPQQSTMSLAPLPGGKLLGGSTIAAGTGGEVKAKEAELYILDLASKALEWHEVVFPGVKNYTDLCAAPDGMVYGVADGARFFVFDPKTRKVVHEENTTATLGGTSGGQGPRVFVVAPGKTVYMLFSKCLAKVEPGTYKLTELAKSPVGIAVGGDYLKGRLYFASGSHLFSWQIPAQ